MPANVHPPRQHAGVAALVGGEERVLAPWSLMVCVCAGGGGGAKRKRKGEGEKYTQIYDDRQGVYTKEN